MPDKVYKGGVEIDIIINMQSDISSSSARSLLIKKPDGDITTWTASVYNTNYLKHTTASGDLNMAGIYYITPKLTFSTQLIYGETAELTVYDYFE